MSSTTVIVVVVVVVIVVLGLAALAWATAGRRRSRRLKERFGPEYDRHLAETDDPARTERELADREKRHRGLTLRELEPRERETFESRWNGVQREFVDNPDRAVEHADALVDEVMSARGYPVDDFEQRAADVSVDHPVVVQRYREAREIAAANRARQADTELLRTAVTNYRELLHALLGTGDEPAAGTNGTQSSANRKETRA